MKTPFETTKYYKITVTLKDEQMDRNGNYAVTCLNLNGTILSDNSLALMQSEEAFSEVMENSVLVTNTDLELFEQMAQKYVEERYEQYPDSGMGHTLHDPDYDVKQEYFLEGVNWLIEQFKNIK